MGCCVSRAADDDDNRQSTVAGGKPFRRTGINWTADSPITQTQLENQRTIFWETAPSYEGRAEIWQALHAAMTSPDIRMAQSIMDAANIILPTGNPAEGCYDELGNRYVIPMYCFIDPTNLIVSENENEQQDHDDTTGMIASTSVPAQTDIKQEEGIDNQDDNEQVNNNNPKNHHHDNNHQQHEDKKSLSSDVPLTTAAAAAAAPAPAPAPTIASNLIPITVRLSTAQDIKVDISKTDETVSSLRTRIYMQTPNISVQTHNIRLIYLGRILQEEDKILYEGFETTIAKTGKESIPEQQSRSIIIANGAIIQALVSKK